MIHFGPCRFHLLQSHMVLIQYPVYEKNGKDYIFVTERKFREKIKSGALLEWAKNFGYYYGTPKDKVKKLLASGKDVILAIDVKGATKIKKLCPDSIFIFILPPSLEELKKRLAKKV